MCHFEDLMKFLTFQNILCSDKKQCSFQTSIYKKIYMYTQIQRLNIVANILFFGYKYFINTYDAMSNFNPKVFIFFYFSTKTYVVGTH